MVGTHSAASSDDAPGASPSELVPLSGTSPPRQVPALDESLLDLVPGSSAPSDNQPVPTEAPMTHLQAEIRKPK
jgi:hypothetical protein